jgi:hypothetical protein
MMPALHAASVQEISPFTSEDRSRPAGRQVEANLVECLDGDQAAHEDKDGDGGKALSGSDLGMAR